MKRILIFFALYTWSKFLYGQKIFSLEQCIDLANNNNIQIRQSTINREITKQNIIQNKGNLLPTINGSINNNFNDGRTIDPFDNTFTTNQVRSNNFGIVGSITLFNGLQTQNSIKQSKYTYLAATYDLELLKNNTALNITSVYLQILFNEELIVLAQNQLDLTRQELLRMNKLVEAGKLAPVVLPDLEAQYAKENLQLINAQNQMRINYVTLTQLLNLNPEEQIKITRPTDILVADTNEINIKEVYDIALNMQPQIKRAEYRRLSLQKALDVAKGRRSPRLTMNASLNTLYATSSRRFLNFQYYGKQAIGYTSSNDTVFAPYSYPVYGSKSFNEQFRDNLNKFWGFTLTVPIMNNNLVKASIAREKLGLQNTELDLEQAKQDLHRAIVTANIDAINAKRRIDAASTAAKAAELALKNAEKRLEVGQINSFDYAQVKNSYAQSSSDLLQANYDYIFKSKILEFYKGKPLKL